MQLSCKEFYSGCEVKESLQRTAGLTKERPKIIGRILQNLAVELSKKGDVEKLIDSICYPESDFEFDFLKKETEDNDKFYLKRFVDWFKKSYHEASISVAQSVQMYFDSPIPFGETEITGIYAIPHLLIQSNAGVELMFLYFSEHRFFKKGRSEHTKLANFLPFLLGKAFYEKHYPGIKTSYVSIKASSEHEKKEFDATGEKGSNYHFICLEEEKIGVTADELKAHIIHILSNPPKKKCYGCPCSTMCEKKGENIWNGCIEKAMQDNTPKAYALPEFTKEQQAVIKHKNGPLLMVAGPGSGKTAVLTARTIELVKNGVAPENILLIAFTNKAVGELKERILTHMPTGRCPHVTTFNSLGFEILKNHSLEVTGTKKIKVLTDVIRKQIIYHLLSVTPKLEGFNYNLITERNGLVDTVIGRMEELNHCHSNEDVSYLKHKYGIGDDFLAFSNKFDTLCKAGGYITFDEQIELCVKYLSTHPQTLKMYHNIYRFIMVDEYQDCNESQYKLIRLLASHGNICVTGDDDQAIYEFRNASSKYMTLFMSDFNAKQILLERNFRCNDSIVTASKGLISPLGNQRIEKALFSKKKGAKPIFINKQDVVTVSNLIESIVAKGYSYGDIAILAKTNKELTNLLKGLNMPCYLAKVRLTEDSLFNLMLSLTELYFNGMDNNEAFIMLLTVLGVSPDTIPNITQTSNVSIYEKILNSCSDARDVHEWEFYENEEREDFIFNILAFVSASFYLIEQGKSACEFCNEITTSLGISEAPSLSAIMSLAEECGTCKQFAEILYYMHKFGDSKMVEMEQSNSIALYTNHSSKGKEFPIVVMTGCEAYKTTQEDLRLAYVGMTRAENELYLLYDGSKSCPLQQLLSDYTT